MSSSELLKPYWEKGISYSAYRGMIDRLLANGKVTGHTQSEAMQRYTELNIARMNKWDKHFTVSEEVALLLSRVRPQNWLVISEGWCGDAAHVLPVLEKMAQASQAIDLRIVLRDENPALIDQYLTNGGKSIPKLIRIDASSGGELSNWGPRPQAAQNLMLSLKAAGTEKSEISKDLQIWYARDRGKSIEKEIAAILGEEA